MRMVFVIYNAKDRGAVISVSRRQAEFLAARGHAVDLVGNQPASWAGVKTISVDLPQTQWSRLSRYIIAGVCRRLPRRFDRRSLTQQKQFVRAAAKTLQRLRAEKGPPDCTLICQHFCTPGLLKIDRNRTAPFVLVAHGDIFSHPKNSFPVALARWYRRSAVLSYRHARHIIAVSASLADQAIRHGACVENVSVVHNGIDPAEIEVSIPCEPDKKEGVALLFCGRLAPEKAVDVLLRAVAQLTDLSFFLHIAGDGPNRQKLEALAQDMNLGLRVVFEGQVDRCDIGEMFRRSDIVILPSLSEAFPLVALEAVTAGCPVIASRVGGVPEIIRHEHNGLLVTPGDVGELASAIRRLCGNPALRDRMSRHALRLAPQFAWGRVLEQFETILLQTVKDTGKETAS